jgi:hypothetical protein
MSYGDKKGGKMIKVDVMTSDSMIWNKEEVFAKISCAIFTNQDLVLDFLNEGPAFENLGINEYICRLQSAVSYSAKIKIVTSNLIESHTGYQVIKKFPNHLMKKSLEYQYPVDKTNVSKHFGMFIGRSNPARLCLASYLYGRHPALTVHTNHLDLHDEFYAANVGIEKLILDYDLTDLDSVTSYIKQCPIAPTLIRLDKSSSANHAEQLLQNDRDIFLKNYDDFAIEIVCETYFTGITFFPTEKIWRPILLKTPFVVQGPIHFLKNLRKLGFKTFSRFWDEGYDEDPHPWSMTEISRVIESVATKSMTELKDMLTDMEDILEHNRCRMIELTNETKHRNLTDIF